MKDLFDDLIESVREFGEIMMDVVGATISILILIAYILVVVRCIIWLGNLILF